MSTKPREQKNTELLIVPDPAVPAEMILISREPKKKGMAVYCTFDGGKTYRSMIPAPTSKDRAGSLLTLDSNLEARWSLPSRTGLEAAVASGTASQFVPFIMVGTLVASQTFGYFKVPAGRTAIVREIQASLQDTADQDTIIDIINGSGHEQGRTVTIPSGDRRSTSILQTPLTMSSRTIWGMKITQCGTSSEPGQNLTILAGIELF